MKPQALNQWHTLIAARNPQLLVDLIADDAVFYSPVVHTPQQGKAVVVRYLSAAIHVFGNDTFKYVRDIVGPHDAMLEFEVQIDGTTINGVDIIQWNENHQIVSFKVMLRPLKAVLLIQTKMAALLSAATTHT